MGPKPLLPEIPDMFRPRLDEQLKMSHPLIGLAKLIQWSVIEDRFSSFFTSTRGRPALRPRLVAGLLYLQHAHALSDEAVVSAWLENPYWQYFCGEPICKPNFLRIPQAWFAGVGGLAKKVSSCYWH